MLNTGDGKVLIIGGGEIAARKTEMLLRYGAHITMVAADFVDRISELNVETIRMQIEDVSKLESLLDDAALVLIATDDSDLNSRIESACVKNEILYNRIDEQKSPVIFPATLESNGVLVSVSTSGKSPAFARFMRDVLARNIEPFTVALPVMERLRQSCQIKDFHSRSMYFSTLLQDEAFWNLIHKQDLDEAYEYGVKQSERYEGTH